MDLATPGAQDGSQLQPVLGPGCGLAGNLHVLLCKAEWLYNVYAFQVSYCVTGGPPVCMPLYCHLLSAGRVHSSAVDDAVGSPCSKLVLACPCRANAACTTVLGEPGFTPEAYATGPDPVRPCRNALHLPHSC